MGLSTIKIIVDTRSLRSPEKLLEFSKGRFGYTLPALFPLEFQVIGQSVCFLLDERTLKIQTIFTYLQIKERKHIHSKTIATSVQQLFVNLTSASSCKAFGRYYVQKLMKEFSHQEDLLFILDLFLIYSFTK